MTSKHNYEIRGHYDNDEDCASSIIDVEIEVDDKIYKDTFNVQLTSGQYLSAAGCIVYNESNGDDINFEKYRDGIFYDISDRIISEAEKVYSDFVKDFIEDGEEWEEIHSESIFITATCKSIQIHEKNKNGKYRIYNDKIGLTSTNEYNFHPEFELRIFDNEQEYEAYKNDNK